MTMHLDLDQLEALSAAMSEGTFDAAARTLHVTPSAVSQRIKALETTVGRVLLTRSKPVALTASGETLLRAARQIQAITANAAHELGEDGSGDPSVIALAVNADSLATWFVPALAAVHPPLAFDLHRADETQTAELLRDGTVMAAVSASPRPVPGCTVTRLGAMRYRPRAAPEFADRWFADGVTIDALAGAPIVTFDRADLLQDRYIRRRTRRRLDPPRHYVPGSTEFVRAIRLGLGWGMVPDLQAPPGDDEFALVELDERGSIDVRLYWQQWRLRSDVLERIARAVRAEANAQLR
jgi:LysR family transcriptional regulator, chromosome initiation inhibitor